MRIDLPDEADPSNVISIEEVRGEYERKRLGKTCAHLRIAVDAREITVTCKDCGERLATNGWLLDRLDAWARLRNLYDRTREAQQKLAEKQRVRCQHCNKVTGTTRDSKFEIVREGASRSSQEET